MPLCCRWHMKADQLHPPLPASSCYLIFLALTACRENSWPQHPIFLCGHGHRGAALGLGWPCLLSSEICVFLAVKSRLGTFGGCFRTWLWSNFCCFHQIPFQKLLLKTKHLWKSAVVPYSSLFWASLRGPEWNTGGNEEVFWTASRLKILDRDLRVFFPQLCVTDLQQTILSSCSLSVTTIEMFPFFLPLSVLSIYILRSLGQGLSLDCTKADRQRHWPYLGSLSVNVITVPEQWMREK